MEQQLEQSAFIRKETVRKNKRKFFHTAVADIFRCIDGQALVAPFSQTLCLIDQMAWVEYGKIRNGFNIWMEKRMAPLSIFYQHTIEELYLIRCGLLHSFGPPADKSGIYKGYLLLPCDTGLHLQRLNSPILRICLYSLVTDTIYATHRTFEDLAENCSDEQMQRLESQIGFPKMKFLDNYSAMHRALACFDTGGEITINDIRSDYTKQILYYEEK
jgi:hypothetical protein